MVIKKLLLMVVGFCAAVQCMDMSMNNLPSASDYLEIDPEIEGFFVRQLPQADSAADTHKRSRTPNEFFCEPACADTVEQLQKRRKELLGELKELDEAAGEASDEGSNETGSRKPRPQKIDWMSCNDLPKRSVTHDEAVQYVSEHPDVSSYGPKDFVAVFALGKVRRGKQYKIFFDSAECRLCNFKFTPQGAVRADNLPRHIIGCSQCIREYGEASDAGSDETDSCKPRPQKIDWMNCNDLPKRSVTHDEAVQYVGEHPDVSSYGPKDFVAVFALGKVSRDERYKIFFDSAECRLCGFNFKSKNAVRVDSLQSHIKSCSRSVCEVDGIFVVKKNSVVHDWMRFNDLEKPQDVAYCNVLKHITENPDIAHYGPEDIMVLFDAGNTYIGKRGRAVFSSAICRLCGLSFQWEDGIEPNKLKIHLNSISCSLFRIGSKKAVEQLDDEQLAWLFEGSRESKTCKRCGASPYLPVGRFPRSHMMKHLSSQKCMASVFYQSGAAEDNE